MARAASPALRVDDIEIFVEGPARAPAIVMVHGWPDTHRLWDAQCEFLASRWRCVRFTLPGFEAGAPRRAVLLAEMLALLAKIVDAVSPRRPVGLMLHDWGCFFGYQYAMANPERIAAIVGVDVGDAGSGEHRRSLTPAAMASIAAYQLWLASAWRIGGPVGDAMTRSMARTAGAPAPRSSVHCGMNYPYDILWTGSHGSYRAAVPFDPPSPMLFVYGTEKPFAFHSAAWADELATRDGCRVEAIESSHWVMTQQPKRFNEAVRDWLERALPTSSAA